MIQKTKKKNIEQKSLSLFQLKFLKIKWIEKLLSGGFYSFIFFSLTPTMETIIIQKSIVFFCIIRNHWFPTKRKKTCLNLVNEQDVPSFTLEIVRLWQVDRYRFSYVCTTTSAQIGGKRICWLPFINNLFKFMLLFCA